MGKVTFKNSRNLTLVGNFYPSSPPSESKVKIVS
jgi:hypothetical protein